MNTPQPEDTKQFEKKKHNLRQHTNTTHIFCRTLLSSHLLHAHKHYWDMKLSFFSFINSQIAIT